jgi:hypothetical protein
MFRGSKPLRDTVFTDTHMHNEEVKKKFEASAAMSTNAETEIAIEKKKVEQYDELLQRQIEAKDALINAYEKMDESYRERFALLESELDAYKKLEKSQDERFTWLEKSHDKEIAWLESELADKVSLTQYCVDLTSLTHYRTRSSQRQLRSLSGVRTACES